MSDGDTSIQTFLRIRPSKKPSGYFAADDLEPNSLKFTLPHNFRSEVINNSKKTHGFHFNGVIAMAATQEDVFNTVGVKAVQNALEGFNSTIFACMSIWFSMCPCMPSLLYALYSFLYFVVLLLLYRWPDRFR